MYPRATVDRMLTKTKRDVFDLELALEDALSSTIRRRDTPGVLLVMYHDRGDCTSVDVVGSSHSHTIEVRDTWEKIYDVAKGLKIGAALTAKERATWQYSVNEKFTDNVVIPLVDLSWAVTLSSQKDKS